VRLPTETSIGSVTSSTVLPSALPNATVLHLRLGDGTMPSVGGSVAAFPIVGYTTLIAGSTAIHATRTRPTGTTLWRAFWIERTRS